MWRTLCANSSVQCQLYCAGIRATANHYLCEAPEDKIGEGIQTIRPVPSGTPLCYYSGTILDHYNGGNHCLELCKWGPHVIYVDGLQRVPSAEIHVAPMQQVNHKCEVNSNCEARAISFNDDVGGLGLLVLVSKQDLAAGEFLSFAYLGDFFQRYTPGNVTPPGYKRIRCACGSGGICPNDLERFEKSVDQPSSYPGSSSLRKTRAKINWPLCPETSATVQLPLFKTGTLADVRIGSKRGLEAQSASKDSDRSVRPGLNGTRKSVKCGPRPDLVVAPTQRTVKELPTQRQMVKKGSSAQLLFCLHGVLQGRGCQQCGREVGICDCVLSGAEARTSRAEISRPDPTSDTRGACEMTQQPGD
jgi:hypothetical protein